MKNTKPQLHSGVVWIISGLAILIYASLGLTNTNIPGAEDLVNFVNSAEGSWLYLAAFISVFIEGLYVIGSFFPGTSLVLLIAILSQVGGITKFLTVIGFIYVGWILAGIINIIGAKYFFKTLHLDTAENQKIQDDARLTWFPAFRSNTEVAQITEGHSMFEVFKASSKIKTYTCLFLIPYAFVIPFITDIQDVDNQEGFMGLLVIASINFGVGGYKIYQHLKQKTA